MSRDGWLPPGITDKDIDDAAPNSDGNQYQCDCCGKMWPVGLLTFVPAGALGNSAGCDTSICPECEERNEDDGQA